MMESTLVHLPAPSCPNRSGRSLTLCPHVHSQQCFFHRGGPTILAAIGHDKSAHVAALFPSLLPDVMIEVPLAGVTGTWALHHRREVGALPDPLAGAGGQGGELAPPQGAAAGNEGGSMVACSSLSVVCRNRTVV